MENRHFLVFPDRLNVIAAMILLAYALIPFVRTTPHELNFTFLGIAISFSLDFTLLISLLAAGLAAVGIDWLMRDNSQLPKRPLYPHYLLPALTAWVIGIPLGMIEISLEWWVVFGLGTALVLTVLISEYISADITDARYPPALMVLTAVSFNLFLTVAIVARGSQFRLYSLLITIVPVFALLSLRLFHLRTGGKWNFLWAAGITLLIAQLAIGLYYLPLSPIRYGLILLGAAYALINTAVTYEAGHPLREKIAESVVMLAVFWMLAFLLG